MVFGEVFFERVNRLVLSFGVCKYFIYDRLYF